MNELYREEMMDIYKNPSHKGKMKNPSVKKKGTNPNCGDEVNLQLKIKNGVIEDAKFDGSACAVSIVSSEILTEAVTGMKIEEALKISKDEFLKKIGLNLTTSRVKCATLVLDALKGALSIYEEKKS